MDQEEKHIDLVGKYLRGSLAGEELSSFLKELEENEALKEELKIQQAIAEGIEHQSNLEVRKKLQAIAAEENNKPGTSIFSMPIFKLVSGIAAVAVLCFAAYFLLNPSQNEQSIYADYFQPSELTITRSTDNESDVVLVTELYNTKKYDQALPLFEKVLESDPQNTNLQLAYSSALMKCNKNTEAREVLNNIINSNNPLFIDEARWILALLDVKTGNINSAKENLNLLAGDEKSYNFSEAREVLEKLNSIEGK